MSCIKLAPVVLSSFSQILNFYKHKFVRVFLISLYVLIVLATVMTKLYSVNIKLILYNNWKSQVVFYWFLCIQISCNLLLPYILKFNLLFLFLAVVTACSSIGYLCSLILVLLRAIE